MDVVEDFYFLADNGGTRFANRIGYDVATRERIAARMKLSREHLDRTLYRHLALTEEATT